MEAKDVCKHEKRNTESIHEGNFVTMVYTCLTCSRVWSRKIDKDKRHKGLPIKW